MNTIQDALSNNEQVNQILNIKEVKEMALGDNLKNISLCGRNRGGKVAKEIKPSGKIALDVIAKVKPPKVPNKMYEMFVTGAAHVEYMQEKEQEEVKNK